MTDENGLNAHLGSRDRKVDEGRAEVVIEAGDTHLNPAGAVHGGAIAALADVATGTFTSAG